MQTLNIDEFCQVRVNSSNFGFTQTWENNTKVHVPNKRKTLLPCFEQIWPLNGLKMTWYSVCLLLFLFRTNSKKGHLEDENDFCHCHGNFFQNWHSESYLVTAMFKVPSQQLQGALTTDTLQFYILWTWIKMHAKSFIKTLVNVTAKKIDEGAWEKINCAKIQACTWFLSNLVFKCNLVLMGIFLDNFHHKLFTFFPFY